MRRLNTAALGSLPRGVEGPRYDRAALTPGVVHLGVGNFFRAHQAVYFDAALNRGESGWGIVGVSLRRPDMRDALAGQDGLYSVVERGEQTRVQVIGALHSLLVAPESPAAVIAAMADPRMRLVTLTITEKGYGLNAQRDAPDWSNADIAHDMAHPTQPRSAAGLLLAALRLRSTSGAPPLTVLSCDNLANNGRALRALVGGLADAQARDSVRAPGRAPAVLRPGGPDELVDRMAVFPSSMVDRIVPHTTDELRGQLRDDWSVDDAWPVATEPFSQWVIEDRFAAQRPRLELSGVQFVADVEPYEAMKLRMLNAAHSAIAYLGVVAGWRTVDEAVSQAPVRRFIERLWQDEIVPSLPREVRGPAPEYSKSLLVRFSNRALGHRCEQIAMDGSQKIPLRWLPTLRARRRELGSCTALALCIAAWIRYLGEADERGRRFTVSDPQAERLVNLLRGLSSAAAARALLSQVDLFGDLGHWPELEQEVVNALESLQACGTLVALDRMNAG